MANSAGTKVAAHAPAWKGTFLDHVMNKMDSPEFVLSTLHPAPSGAPTQYVPHARFCVFRGMWAELPENKHNDAPKNARVFESEMPTFTTDVRMQKVGEIFNSSHGSADQSREFNEGSGGGGPVEAVWWVKDQMTQWRVKGQAFVVGQDVETSTEPVSSGVRTVKSELMKRMRVMKPGQEKTWSWQTEVTGHFGNMSPAMRGSFKQPPPGQEKSKPYNDKEEGLGNKVTSLDDPVSRKHFRVVVIRPEQVEMLDLSDQSSAKRLVYNFDEASGDWTVEETWP